MIQGFTKQELPHSYQVSIKIVLPGQRAHIEWKRFPIGLIEFLPQFLGITAIKGPLVQGEIGQDVDELVNFCVGCSQSEAKNIINES